MKIVKHPFNFAVCFKFNFKISVHKTEDNYIHKLFSN